MPVQDLISRLSMPEPSEMKKEIDEEAARYEGANDPKDSLDKSEPDSALEKKEKKDPNYALKTKPEYTFKFRWQATPTSRVWNASLTTKILNQKEQTLVSQLRARLAGGLPFESLDPLAVERNLIVAHLSYCLVGTKPEWLNDIGAIHDLRILQEIYMEVASHEAIFFEQ